MHLYSMPSWALPKTGRVYCGRVVSKSKMVTQEDDVTCPHCLAILKANKKALAAIKAEHAAGRYIDMSPEALEIIKESNQIWSDNYGGNR